MSISIKNKEDKTAIITENFVYINNDEPELMLFLDMLNI